jgi:hypothetical protein
MGSHVVRRRLRRKLHHHDLIKPVGRSSSIRRWFPPPTFLVMCAVLSSCNVYVSTTHPPVNMGACLLRDVGHGSYVVVVVACISRVHAVVRG